MRALKYVGALALALVVHLTLVSSLPAVARVVDPFLLVIVLLAMPGRVGASLLTGTVTGLVQDAVSGGVYGLYGLAGCVVGFVMARSAQVLSLQKIYYVALFFASAMLVQQIVLQGLLLTLLPQFEQPELRDMLWKVGIAGVLGAGLVAISESGAERIARWRRERRVGTSFRDAG